MINNGEIVTKKIMVFGVILSLISVSVVSLFFHFHEARAAGSVYYVDQATGDDSDSGLTEDLSWATITQAADTLVAGDTVYIKNGTYREGKTFPTAGTSGNPITFSAFPGHAPIMNGSLEVTGWSLHAGNVYKATWNNTSAGFWEDTDLLLTPNGAVPDAAGEWYLDDAGNELYVWASDSANPSTHTYEASTTTLGNAQGNVIAIGVDYLTFIGITTVHANNDGINIGSDVEGLIFTDMTSEDNTYDGYSQHDASRATASNLVLNRNGKCNLANVDSSYINLDGLNMTQGTYGPNYAANILFTSTSSADITNSTIDQGSYKNNYAFYPLTAGEVNISDSTIIGGSSSGTVNTQEHTTFNRVIIDGGGAGRTMRIAADSGDRVIVRNSIIKNIGTDGFFPITNGAKIRVENSLVIGQSSGSVFWAYAVNSEIDVYNTIIADNPLRTFHRTDGAVTEDYNMLYNSDGYTVGITPGTNTVTDDPDFVDYVGEDYGLLSTSPAIDSAISTYSPSM